MCHTEAEVGLIDGMRRSYFAPQSISEQVRLRYWKTHQHLSGSTGIVDFKFEYRVKYDSGSSYDRKTELSGSISKEEYRKIVRGVLEGTSIEHIIISSRKTLDTALLGFSHRGSQNTDAAFGK